MERQKMEAKFYRIQAITNLHAGSGDINFNIVDNEVQRDPVTGYPTIFSSSLKGALRQHFAGESNITEIFGSERKESIGLKEKGSKPGRLKFFGASMLLFPVRAAKGKQLYYLLTSPVILQSFASLYEKLTGCADLLKDALEECGTIANDKCLIYGEDEIGIEGGIYKTSAWKDKERCGQNLQTVFGLTGDDLKRLAIVPDGDLGRLHLPVLARNQLENGVSKNLWYEEIVPHEAVFTTAVLSDGTGKDVLDAFDGYIRDHELLQLGGNATIGYGLTQMTALASGEGK